jgi:hypothetical protein
MPQLSVQKDVETCAQSPYSTTASQTQNPRTGLNAGTSSMGLEDDYGFKPYDQEISFS